MTGSNTIDQQELQTAQERWKEWGKGNPEALESVIETGDDLLQTGLKEEIEELKGSATRVNRFELHFKLALYRDLRYSVAGSQYCLRLAAWNRQRAVPETARVMLPYDNAQKSS